MGLSAITFIVCVVDLWVGACAEQKVKSPLSQQIELRADVIWDMPSYWTLADWMVTGNDCSLLLLFFSKRPSSPHKSFIHFSESDRVDRETVESEADKAKNRIAENISMMLCLKDMMRFYKSCCIRNYTLHRKAFYLLPFPNAVCV